MQYNLINTGEGPTNNGTYSKSNGGTEQMYNGLMARLPKELTDKVQIICSRVRNLEPDKKHVLWLHDWWRDPENAHLSDPKSLERFDKLVFVSNHQFQTYHQAYGVPYGKSVVLRNAIVPIEWQDKPKDRVNLIYHTTPHRGLELLIPAFDKLVELNPDKNLHLDVFSSFSIYGWPDRDKQYERVFEACRNHPNITYHGYQPNDVVRAALQQAHIFAYPNVWPETSCIAGIEAAAAGCIVVCPDYAALPETLANYGFFYRFNEDPNVHVNLFASVLNAAIARVHEDEIIEVTKQQAEGFNAQYSWDARAPQWVELLTSLA